MWSGSQSISGSIQSGSGMFIETGAPYYHSIKAAYGGKIEIVADGIPGSGGVTNATFNAYTSSVQEASYYQTLFGIPCVIDAGDDRKYNLQIRCLNGVVFFTSSLAEW